MHWNETEDLHSQDLSSSNFGRWWGNASNAYLNKILVLQKRVLRLIYFMIEESMPSLYLPKQKFCLLRSYIMKP